MIAMTKLEIARYLSDYSMIRYLIGHHRNQNIKTLFHNYMMASGRTEDDTEEYYIRMCRVFAISNIMKKFSYAEDFLLNVDSYINYSELEKIIPKDSYYTDMSKLSNKKILKLIRNTFNHNDSEIIDRFKISVNGKYIEIELLEPPTKLKFGIDDLISIYNNMIEHSNNKLSINYDIPDDFDINSNDLFAELSKIKFVHYYFDNQLPKSLINQFDKITNSKIITNEDARLVEEKLTDLSNKINTPIKFDLSEEQKKKIQYEILSFKKNNPQQFKIFCENDQTALMKYFLNKVIPIPLLKDKSLNNQILFNDIIMGNIELSYNDTLIIIPTYIAQVQQNNITGNKPSKSEYFSNPFYDYSNFDQLCFQFDLTKSDFIMKEPIITFIDFVVTHCCNEEKININGIDYNTKKIRNSFVHGRWYITDGNYMMMFDAKPKNVYDYDLEFLGKFKIEDFDDWALTFLTNNTKKNNIRR